ncbi:putative uncharacterized protein DDB_G0277255 isoform X3 [Aphidius gifuensis]|uniref:putative uncharacterized protein DDB_G0277255 isoform X3 n=1 Tax=Aphidius gifuensis TaxID=684658 RepID=UPI001CDD35A8|nr:putative uncharacterized protein DDB_G0277255 isoform X3 [Aphidius gifuensis]
MVDLGGYIIILMNENGKIKLYGSSADSADYPEVGDEILEVNGQTLENATDLEVSQHIHQCIKSGTISLQVTRRTGNKLKLDGPNADRIRDAWVIALERGARERLQRLPALKKIQPRDIQAILHQQINEGSASTSTGETTEKDITNSHITVTLADGQSENRNATNKLSNGTVPKNITNNETDDKKEILEKQKNHLEELKLLQPIQNNCITERRSSSPFQNGRTEVLIGETEGGPRSPRGSTSSAINDANLLNLPGETDNPEPICRSRRRSGSGVADIHLQQSQLNDNNNVVTIDNNDIKNIRDNQTGPNEMWSPGMTPGHHRELPVDVPDTLLQQAYAHKVIKDNTSNLRKQKPPRIPPPPPRINTKLITTTTTTSTTSTITTTTTTTTPCDSDINKKNHINNINNNTTTKITSSMSNINKKQLFNDDNDKSYNDNDETDYKIVELTLINNDKNGIIINNNNNNSNNNNNNNKKLKINKKIIIDGKETSVDIDNNNTDYDYPFAKEDYPTMLKTCSDSSTSTRSTSSGHSGSTAALDTSLTLHSDKEDKDKEELLLLSSTISTTTTAIPLATTAIASIITASSSLSSSSSSSSTASSSSSKLYDTTRIDLGSPCRPIGITSTQTVYNLSNIGNERDDKNCVSYDNPTYEIGINDSDENILIQNDDINDLSKLIKNNNNIKNKSINKKMIKSPKKIINDDVLLSIGSASTENLLTDDNDNFTTTTTATTTTIDSNNKFKKKINKISNNKQISSGYSTLKSQTDSSYLVLNSNKKYREVAVDVPADFIPMEKSHPTYPPNKKLQQQQQHNEDDKHEEDYDDDDRNNTGIKAGVHNGVKPAIPPRDQKRAPARPPKDNLRLSNRNSNIDNNETTTNDAIQQPQPTPQQLHSIKKYQAQLRQRKDHEERQEYLNQSLRGSRKLHALESHTTSLSGMENYAYTQDEVTTSTTPSLSTVQKSQSSSTKTTDETSKILTYGEVIVILERLQMQLTTLSGALGIAGPGVEAELEAVRTLLVQKKFATALATHHALKSKLRSGKLAKHYADDATNLSRDCVEVLEEWQSSNAKSNDNIAIIEELTGLLTSYEVEGLLLAHDSVISYIDGVERKQYPSSTSPSQSPSPTSSSHDFRNTENIKIIRIEKTNEPLGATVRNEGDAVIIGRIVRGGAADKSGLFNEGDEVLEVNGVEMRGKSVNEVCDILAGMQGSLTFLVLPVSNNHRNNITNNTRRDDNTLIHHVRAYFDYDPEDDPYIPCRELGVGFQKGDVLHVISQEDSNWWQAYREGEEDQTLAGLIPSRAFQHQREKMKQTITGDKNTLRGGKKSNTLLCTRKNQKKKKKRTKFGGNVNEDGYPLYSTTSIDDYDSEEVLTYEEVALYYPRASHKRPVVLIGPPNIGRHELRQRLMQDSERFAAAIPHTSRPRKGSEVDGQDYHFISRSQFESDILCRKFVEHGEYEKSFYGTSVEAIRSVVNSGKICVLNLHPQSLKILRNSDLKPYVVFVAPPNPEKLRQKRIKNNESFKEEELKDIIEKAREMEDKYGHLFDMIIINNDTDRAYNQLLTEINSLEREPQWVPATWVQ